MINHRILTKQLLWIAWLFVLPSAMAAPVAVIAAKAEAATEAPVLTVPGNLEPFEKARLFAKVTGYVESVMVDIGDEVKAGDLLATLTIPEMEAALVLEQSRLLKPIAGLAKAHADLQLAKVTYERLHKLRLTNPGAIPEQDVDVAKAHQAVAEAAIGIAQAEVKIGESELERLHRLMDY